MTYKWSVTGLAGNATSRVMAGNARQDGHDGEGDDVCPLLPLGPVHGILWIVRAIPSQGVGIKVGIVRRRPSRVFLCLFIDLVWSQRSGSRLCAQGDRRVALGAVLGEARLLVCVRHGRGRRMYAGRANISGSTRRCEWLSDRGKTLLSRAGGREREAWV